MDGLIAFRRGFDGTALPAEALARAGDAVVDALGCILLGARQPLERRLRRALLADVAAGDLARELDPATLGAARSETQGAAALYLGALAHAADFDDISHPAYCHLTALLLPALLVRGAALGASGRDLLAAHILGIEVLGQLGRRLNTAHYERGWHATATLGTLAATAALAALERFSDTALRRALGIAASLAGGIRENFGTETKPLHAGLPGRSAILATRLAAAGLTSADTAIEGPQGFLAVFGGAAEPGNGKAWGAPLEILTEAGIALKAYPACAATHPAIDAARRLVARHGRLSAEAVRRVEVGVSRFALKPLIHDLPRTPLEAKFSMRFCVAAALHDGEVGLATFAAEPAARPEIGRLMGRIAVAVDPRVAEDREFASIVTLHLSDGRVDELPSAVTRGKPGNWLSPEEIRRKFLDCAGPAAAAPGRALLALAAGPAGPRPAAELLGALARGVAAAAAAAA